MRCHKISFMLTAKSENGHSLFIHKVFLLVTLSYPSPPVLFLHKLKYFDKSRGTFNQTNVSSRTTKVFFATVYLQIVATLMRRLASVESFHNMKCRLIDFEHSVRLRHTIVLRVQIAYIAEDCLLRDLGYTPTTSIAIYWQIEDVAKFSFRVIKNLYAQACTAPLLSPHVLKTPHHLWQKKMSNWALI